MRYSQLIADPVRAGLLLACIAGLFCSAGAAPAQTAGGSSPSPATSTPAAPAPVTPAPMTFDVEAYDVDGATLLQQVDIETAVYPFLGPGRTREDIGHARDALEKAYRDRGYQSVVVQVPPQSVSDNIVRLHVVEATVGRMRVTGARYFSPDFIRSEASAFQEGQVPNISEAQRQLADINRLPDRRVTPLLKAGQIPGTVDVDLKVSDTLPVHASVEVNNDHNQFTPPLRVLSTISYDNLWQLGHTATFTYVVAPQNRSTSEVFAGSYMAPIWGSPWTMLAYGYTSNSNVATLGGVLALGRGYDIGVRAILALPRRGDVSQSLSFGFDYKHFFSDTVIGGADFCLPPPATNPSCALARYWPFNITYNLQRDSGRFSTKLSLGLTIGTIGDAVQGGATVDFSEARFDASPNFVHLNLDLAQTEALPHGFEAFQHLVGQIADQPLVSSEQFGAGGLTSVRGYLQSEAVGDNGFSGTLELRSPSLAPKIGAYVDDLRLYAFADGAVASVIDPLAGQTAFFALASAGVGLRVGLLQHLKGEVVGAVPLINGVATQKDRPQVTFSVKSAF